MHRSNCEFHGRTRPEAEAKLNEWKKSNAKAVAIVVQIIEMPSTHLDGCVIRVEYETTSNNP
jgi:hypothetical protein